jgi:hypothetical protein
MGPVHCVQTIIDEQVALADADNVVCNTPKIVSAAWVESKSLKF